MLTPTEGAQDAADSQAEEHELLGGTNQGLGSSSTHLSPAPAGAAGELQHHESPAGRSMLSQGGLPALAPCSDSPTTPLGFTPLCLWEGSGDRGWCSTWLVATRVTHRAGACPGLQPKAWAALLAPGSTAGRGAPKPEPGLGLVLPCHTARVPSAAP